MATIVMIDIYCSIKISTIAKLAWRCLTGQLHKNEMTQYETIQKIIQFCRGDLSGSGEFQGRWDGIMLFLLNHKSIGSFLFSFLFFTFCKEKALIPFIPYPPCGCWFETTVILFYVEPYCFGYERDKHIVSITSPFSEKRPQWNAVWNPSVFDMLIDMLVDFKNKIYFWYFYIFGRV